MNRRDVLKSGGFAAALVAASGSVLAARVRDSRQLDLNDPAAVLEAYVRLRGSSATETVWRPYEADLFVVQDGELGMPLCGVVGVQKSHWVRTVESGVTTYSHKDFDVGVYVDFESREPLTRWRNPFTGRTVVAQPYRSGPSGTAYRVGAASHDVYSNPSEGRWTRIGPQISHTSVKTVEVRNPLSPEKYPLASTGKSLKISMSTTFMGSLADLANPALHNPPSTLIWTDLTPWNPWMEMGLLRGQVFWRLVGNKAAGMADLPSDVVALMEAVVPGYVLKDTIWDGPNISGYQEYMRTHPVPAEPS